MGKTKFTFQYVSIISYNIHVNLLSQRNLHSNMFLLFLNPICHRIAYLSIFTFQYVSIISFSGKQLCDRCLYLHSNMFLLFPVKLSSIALSITFTFQYVSIISVQSLLLIPVLSWFTFQYVSIISGSDRSGTPDTIHLHSNMFLLFQYNSFHHWLHHFIYIPICFYYFIVAVDFTAPPVFIYIPICFYYFWNHDWISRIRVLNLHSNMFLLFQDLTDW